MLGLENIHEECGIFGVYNYNYAPFLVHRGLLEIQHRGQEGCGIAWNEGNGKMGCRKGQGLVSKVFGPWTMDSVSENLTSAIGHVRYGTSGGGGIENVQPFVFKQIEGHYAIAHNGNIVNADILKQRLSAQGTIFGSSSDSEIIAHLINRARKRGESRFTEAIRKAMYQLDGAVSLLVLTPEAMYACRDRYGFRPLSLGQVNGSYVISSETCAFTAMGITWIRDIEPGEIVRISADGIESISSKEPLGHKMCAMEYIYFARPDSDIEGINVHTFRKESGKILFKECPARADMVVGVPDSGMSAAIGYSEASGIPMEMGIVRNNYVARTFIQPTQDLRELGVRMKLTPVKSLIQGKRLVVVDDSIVRGTTSRKLVQLLKAAGASEVHMRISSPMITGPCFYGVDISTSDKLLCANNDCQAACEAIGADSLGFISESGLMKAGGRSDLCLACFNKLYPTDLYSNSL